MLARSWSAARASLVNRARALPTRTYVDEAGLKFIYVGNIPWKATEDDLRSAFKAYGTVERVRIVRDKTTGRSQGFGFVGFSSDIAPAISAQVELQGRVLRVNEAKGPQRTRNNTEQNIEADTAPKEEN